MIKQSSADENDRDILDGFDQTPVPFDGKRNSKFIKECPRKRRLLELTNNDQTSNNNFQIQRQLSGIMQQIVLPEDRQALCQEFKQEIIDEEIKEQTQVKVHQYIAYVQDYSKSNISCDAAHPFLVGRVKQIDTGNEYGDLYVHVYRSCIVQGKNIPVPSKDEFQTYVPVYEGGDYCDYVWTQCILATIDRSKARQRIILNDDEIKEIENALTSYYKSNSSSTTDPSPDPVHDQ
jgi:hypothetical protein